MSADHRLFNEQELESRIELIRKHVARPIPKQPWDDNNPALIPFHEPTDPDASRGEGGIIIGSARHAANIPLLKSLNVIAVLNCASGGIARLPVDELKECGIRYAFTNCRRDSYDYPILHEKKKTANDGGDDIEESYVCSQHLEVASELFIEIRCQNSGNAKQQRAGKLDATTETETSKTPCNILFFCVAGQNRSAALAVATMILHGKPLEECLKHCADKRPFVLENIGFQRQVVELEAILRNLKSKGAAIRNQFRSHWTLYEQANKSLKALQQTKRIRIPEDKDGVDTKLMTITDRPISTQIPRSKSEYDVLAGTKVEIELLIPGLCTMEVRIPRECTIPELKRCLIQHANENLLFHDMRPCKVAKAWVVIAMFGYDDMYDIPLEVEAVELKVQLKRIKSMFGLTSRLVNGEPRVVWNEKCRFALVIFSVIRLPTELSSKISTDSSMTMDVDDDDEDPALSPDQVPWTFEHEERPGAPATLLENTLRSTHLRAWDFVTGEALASSVPTVFSYAEDPRDKRAFMMVSKSANTLQHFRFGDPKGDILGMGENAIVHRVQLNHTKPDGAHRDENWTRVNIGLENSRRMSVQSDIVSISTTNTETEEWDAAVKRPFSLAKMLAFLKNSSEAGLAKRLRLANLLNSDKRVLYFYGLGLGLSTNAYNNNEYKFELMLLSKYEQEFSTYTMREFMEEYVAVPSSVDVDERRRAIQKLQSGFTITSVKVFLVSLLNAFRDLTLMGVQAFDFNHLNNVLVSRDYRQVRLIDIDGNSQGSIDYPAVEFSNGALSMRPNPPQRPCLDVDLNVLLPSVIEQLMLGKGRGKSFVSNKRSEIWHAKEEDGKELVRKLLTENFYSTSFNHNGLDDEAKFKLQKHVNKLAEWFYALLKKQPPWNNWTHDIYDAMRCIDHLPIS